MVKVGFICEGHTETILLESTRFRQFLNDLNIELVNVINAAGCDNLLPHNINGYIQSLEKDDAEVIIILTDLDTDLCITRTKERIAARPKDVVVIAVKQIEAWFLACTDAMRLLLTNNEFNFQFPENEISPFITINNLLITNTGRGIGRHSSGKIKLITRLVRNGLDLREAAAHPNCPSAKYFISKLTQIGAMT